MKVEVNEKNNKESKSEFPKLMKANTDDDIVLFFDEKRGYLINAPNQHYYHDWNITAFSPFTGTITLSND